MTYQEKFELIGRDCDLIDAEIAHLQAELERKIKRKAQADAFVKAFVGDALVEPVADEPVIAPVPVVDDQPEIISEPVRDEPVIVAPTVVADEPVVVPPAPAPAPSADSDLGAMLAAIQRAGVKVGNDFKPVVVADNPEPQVAETVERQPIFSPAFGRVDAIVYYDHMIYAILEDHPTLIYEGSVYQNSPISDPDTYEREGYDPLIVAALDQSFESRDAVMIDGEDYALCEVFSEGRKGKWFKESELHEEAAQYGLTISRPNVRNRMSKSPKSLMKRFPGVFEERQKPALAWRLA